MKIIIISRSPWRLDNSFGNTYSSIFRDMENVEIANIYLADGRPEYEENVKAYYQVSEKELIYLLKHPFSKRKVGKLAFAEDSSLSSKEIDSTYLAVGKKKRWPLMFLVREFLWKFGKVNYCGIDKFVEDFKPDIIFLPYYYAVYVYRIALYIQNKYNLPMTGEAALDIYSLKQLSFDPIYWLNRFWIRSWIRKTARRSASLYLISEKMQKDYFKFLKIPCKVLYKIPDFSRKQSEYTKVGNPVRFLYTGNLGAKRWKTLSLLAKALKRNNWGHLDIFSATPITNTISAALNVEGFSEIHPPVSQYEVTKLQNDTDVLVHTESFDLSSKLLVRYSISTKIMDYLCMGRAILGIGPKDIASIEYLRDNDVAMVATSQKEIDELIEQLKNNPNKVLEYSNKGLTFAMTQMNAKEMKLSLYNDMQEIIDSHVKGL